MSAKEERRERLRHFSVMSLCVAVAVIVWGFLGAFFARWGWMFASYLIEG